MSRFWKIGSIRRLIACAALIASTLSLAVGSPGQAQAQTTAPAQTTQQQPAPVSSDVRAVLSQFGTFVQHQRYGEVWIPNATPPNWHPYPACHWVNTRQYGWYYDDKTPWGQIVHHYGRWAFDDNVGWYWVPGAEFSPGWVMWRTSPQWIGWAPTPPDEEIQTGAAEVESANYWTFMETAKFSTGCNETQVVSGQRSLQIVRQTTVVREFEIVNGILVFVLPPYVIGPVIDINIVFTPWPNWFFTQVLIDWNWFWNNVSVVIVIDCPPQKPPVIQPIVNPPPSTQAPPSQQPPYVTPPVIPIVNPNPTPICPDGGHPNAYGVCPSIPAHVCGPGTVARGPFCIAIQDPGCGPGLIRTPDGCRPFIPGINCGTNERRVDGKCIPIGDTGQDCRANERRVDGRCIPIGDTGQACRTDEHRMDGRCVPNGPVVINDKPPVIRPIGDRCLLAGGCALNHPTDPVRPVRPTQPNLPNLTKGPNNVLVPHDPPKTTGGPYVIGRGSAGHNVFSGNSGPAGGNSGGGKTVPFRTTPAQIQHTLPQKTSAIR